MSRHEQRRRRLQNPDVTAGYWGMDSELRLIEALDMVRRRENLSIEELVRRMDRHREVVSRLFNAERPNPTVKTFTAILRAMGITAEILLRRAHEGESPMNVAVDLPEEVPA